MASRKTRKPAHSVTSEPEPSAASETQLQAPPSSDGPDYGRETLYRCNFFRGRGPIEPGVFLRSTEMWTWEPVAETSIDYRAIALDRSPSDRSPGYMHGLRSTHVFDPPRHLGYEVWEVDQHQARHPDPKIARIIDLCDALSDEHARFREFKLWEGSGYLAPSEDVCGVSYYEGPSGLLPPASDVQYICRCEVPSQARRIVSRLGAVYSSHLRVEPPQGYEDLHGLGIAGPLSVAGHLVCLWAVLRDRLRELLRRPGIVGTAVHLQRLVACDRQPIDWTDEERGWLEAAKAEAQALGGSTGGAGHDAGATQPRLEDVHTQECSPPALEAKPPAVGFGASVAVVRAALLELVKNKQPYTSRKELGKVLKCSPSQIGKAIKPEPILRGWMKRHDPRNRAALSTTSMAKAEFEGASQSREAAPDEAAMDAEAEDNAQAEIERLTKEQSEEKRRDERFPTRRASGARVRGGR